MAINRGGGRCVDRFDWPRHAVEHGRTEAPFGATRWRFSRSWAAGPTVAAL